MNSRYIYLAFESCDVPRLQNRNLVNPSTYSIEDTADFDNPSWLLNTQVPDGIIDSNPGILHEFSDQALKFYLPAYIAYSINNILSTTALFTFFFIEGNYRKLVEIFPTAVHVIDEYIAICKRNDL
jgi:hypothetical protein